MNKKFKVLLTNPIHSDCHQDLANVCDVVVAPNTKAETLKELIADCDGLIVRCQLPQDIFDGAKKLRAVVRHGVGLDFIPVEALSPDSRLRIGSCPGNPCKDLL